MSKTTNTCRECPEWTAGTHKNKDNVLGWCAVRKAEKYNNYRTVCQLHPMRPIAERTAAFDRIGMVMPTNDLFPRFKHHNVF